MKLIQIIGYIIVLFVLGLFLALPFLDNNKTFTKENIEAIAEMADEKHAEFLTPKLQSLEGQSLGKAEMLGTLNQFFTEVNQEIETAKQADPDKYGGHYAMGDYHKKTIKYWTGSYMGDGFVAHNKVLLMWLLLGGVFLGGFFIILPMFNEVPGIKNNGVYFSTVYNRGWIGIALGILMIIFYLFIYFADPLIVEWGMAFDPMSEWFGAGKASHWFMYGLLYTIAVLIMGMRMVAKYRHNNYQLVRTASVMFFQLGFAFLLPQFLSAMNLPADDLKNAWPLNYSMFFDYNIQNHINAGTAGVVMLFWGILFSAIGVPLLTYFYGKRWYCSWVCGCGGLAETLGDPFRQQSSKTLGAWRLERWLIHGVLVFAIIMTIAVLYGFAFKDDSPISVPFLLMMLTMIFMLIFAGTKIFKDQLQEADNKVRNIILGIVGVIVILLAIAFFTDSNKVFMIDDYQVRKYYGLLVSSIFAGVVGTGFYPLLGNRVWCRFGCPLAAWMGMIQRFQSRFRITTNGGQCISCGNCSTYCEMGIDVRAYAQKGQDIVRSSCVGCGVCSAVCPRGVLRLENGTSDISERTSQMRTIHVTEDQITILG
ncbi:MAG: polyferredoxin [Maribacter sp.]|jgi:polyferredoxin